MSSSLHMRRLRGADPHAIEELYREYHPRLLSFCRHMLGDAEEAEDVVQLTFLAAHVQLPHERIETSVGAWLFTVARRRCVDVLRRRREDVPLSDEEVSTRGLAAEVEGREELRRLVADLQRLDSTHRAALLLTQLEALPQAQVAQVLGTHEARVRRLVFEARQSLLERRESRDLNCRAVQEELANARGSQFRRRHLVAHCEQCEECARYRTALLDQRAALRVVLPAFAVLIPARKAWASASVPKPHGSLGWWAARVPSPVVGMAVVVATLFAAGGLPAGAPAPAPVRFEAPSSVAPPATARAAGVARADPAIHVPGLGFLPTTTPRAVETTSSVVSAAQGVAAGGPVRGEPVRTPPEPPETVTNDVPPPDEETVTVPAVTTPVVTTPPVTVAVPPVTVPEPEVPPPSTVPQEEEPPPERPECGFEGTPC